MRSVWFQVLAVGFLLGLLVLLASLQYRWLGQISDSERTRLEARLKEDTRRFTEDFNREINDPYFIFQLTADDWESFPKRHDLWRKKAASGRLVKEIYYARSSKERPLTKYSPEKRAFEETTWTDELNEISRSFRNANAIEQFSEAHLALIVPVYRSRQEFEKLLEKGELSRQRKADSEFKMPQKDGFLILRLDRDTITAEILPELVERYFRNVGVGDFRVSVTDRTGAPVFQTEPGKLNRVDFESRLFNLSPEAVWILAEDSETKVGRVKTKRIVIGNPKTSSPEAPDRPKQGAKGDESEIDVEQEQQMRIFEGNAEQFDGIWTLRVQRKEGSLDQFITNTRRRNLAISFGIMSLLAISMVLIFLSSHRARALAQKQLDFVSSVSHEFRTPVSVIYSAGENLSDGLIGEEKISSYGNLIKREGKKLSGMVEQILEFAGARSGRRRFDFRNVDPIEVVEDALAECEPAIAEKGFEVEKDFASGLPAISADSNALSHAIQNLVRNSLKYSNGSKWLRISVDRENDEVRIAVSDKGIGISKKDQSRIFEPFYRGDRIVDEQISGNGLGLSLVKQIVDAHRARVSVTSEVGEGSEFCIHFPIAEVS